MTVVLDTSSCLPERRLAVWQDIVCDTFVGLDCKSDMRGAFWGSVSQARIGPVALTQVDTTVIAQEPRLAKHRVEIQESLAKLLGVDAARVNVKLKSTDGLGALGRAEGIAAQAVVLLEGRGS